MVSRDELLQCMPQLTPELADAYLPHLQDAFRTYKVNTRLREAAALAQLGHESLDLLHWREIWGPTPAQRGYEARADLGNTKAGDGYLFRGRGPIQLTGRANYRKYGQRLGLDLEGNPDQVATPEVGFQTSLLYWHLNGCNELADRGDTRALTRRINGGLNGFEDRERRYCHALAVLDDERAVTVVIDGYVLRTSGIQRNSVVWLPLREACDLLFWTIVATADDAALLEREGRPEQRPEQREVPLWISDAGVGYTRCDRLSAALGLRKSWSPEDRTVTLLSPRRAGDG